MVENAEYLLLVKNTSPEPEPDTLSAAEQLRIARVRAARAAYWSPAVAGMSRFEKVVEAVLGASVPSGDPVDIA